MHTHTHYTYLYIYISVFFNLDNAPLNFSKHPFTRQKKNTTTL